MLAYGVLVEYVAVFAVQDYQWITLPVLEGAQTPLHCCCTALCDVCV